MRYLVLATALSALSTASPTRPSSPRRPLLALVPHGVPSPVSALPCSQYLSTVGVATLSDVYYLDRDCAGTNALSGPFADSVAQLDQPLSEHNSAQLSRLVWVHSPRIDRVDASSFVPETFDHTFATSPRSQVPFSASPLSPLPTRLLSLPSNGDAAEGSIHILSPKPAVALEQLEYLTSHPLTALLTLVSIPLPPSVTSKTTADEPRFPKVPTRDVERVEHWLHSLGFEPLLSALLADMKVKGIERDVRTLSGEDQRDLHEADRWVTRHSMSTGAIAASSWLLAQMRSYDFTCTPHVFLPGFSPMLECVYNRSGTGSSSNETVVLGAHLDSRG
ncbi:hypothetical protein JCM16303_006036, partial [Sporobolomyces ruberrimus]